MYRRTSTLLSPKYHFSEYVLNLVNSLQFWTFWLTILQNFDSELPLISLIGTFCYTCSKPFHSIRTKFIELNFRGIFFFDKKLYFLAMLSWLASHIFSELPKNVSLASSGTLESTKSAKSSLKTRRQKFLPVQWGLSVISEICPRIV